MHTTYIVYCCSMLCIYRHYYATLSDYYSPHMSSWYTAHILIVYKLCRYCIITTLLTMIIIACCCLIVWICNVPPQSQMQTRRRKNEQVLWDNKPHPRRVYKREGPRAQRTHRAAGQSSASTCREHQITTSAGTNDDASSPTDIFICSQYKWK
jgi:hypothetical protein